MTVKVGTLVAALLIMSTVQDTIEDIRKRLNELESQASDNVPVARPPITPRITQIPPIFNPYVQPELVATFETKERNNKIFNGSFSFQDFLVLGIYTLIIMFSIKYIITNNIS